MKQSIFKKQIKSIAFIAASLSTDEVCLWPEHTKRIQSCFTNTCNMNLAYLVCSASHLSPCEYTFVSTDGESQAPSTTSPCSGKSHTLSNRKLLLDLPRGTQPIFDVFNLKICVFIAVVDMCLLVLCYPETISSWRGVHITKM